MTSKNEPTLDLSNAFGDLTKMFEQFKVPGIDTQELLDARRKDVEALMQANRALYEGMQAMANKQSELLKTAMADIQSAMTGGAGGAAGAGVGDPVKQAELGRKACEKVLGDMKDLAEMARASQTDALAKITQRSTENLDAVKKMMKLK